MKKDKLIKYIENPEKLGEYSLADMRTLLQRYPFFQLGYFLFLLNLKNISDPRFNEYLAKFAIYIKDRNELFRKLNYIESMSLDNEDKKKENNHSENLSDNEQSDYKTESSLSPKTQDAKLDNKTHDKSVVKKTTEEKKKNQYTRAYLSDRISATLSNQISEADEKEELKDELHTDFFILDKADTIKGKTEAAKEDDKVLEDNSGSTEKNKEDLLELENKNDKGEQESDNINKTNKSNAGNEYFEDDLLKSLSDRQSQHNTDLIDKFIQETPELKIKQPQDTEQKDISEKYVKENENLLTEKLAELYIKQAYYEKAIEAFEKLSLKYPEKSDYFAERIQKVKQIINEQQK
ncbi:MAG: hypothetical protein R6U04_00110 [Bacteroidales bacterium]